MTSAEHSIGLGTSGWGYLILEPSLGGSGKYRTSAYFLFVIVLMSFTAHAQEHKFWDTQNKILVPSYLALTASDAAATEHIWRSGPGWSEANPLVPDSRAGRVAYFSATAGAVIGASYLAHRTGHHKWEHVILWIGNGTEAQASTTTWIRGPK